MSKVILFATAFLIHFLFFFVGELKINAQTTVNYTELEERWKLYNKMVANPPFDTETARQARNEFIVRIETLIDQNFAAYENRVADNKSWKDLTKDVLNFDFAVPPDTKPKAIGDDDCLKRKKTDFECFLDSITRINKKNLPSADVNATLLLLAMRIARLQVETEIDARLKLDVENYSLADAQQDLRRYYAAGTPVGATKALNVILDQLERQKAVKH